MNSCSGNGKCIDREGGVTECLCETGWGGEICNENIVDECMSNPCENQGQCVDGIRNFTCHCSAPWTGILCENGRSIQKHILMQYRE